jgi:hypothetical protein
MTAQAYQDFMWYCRHTRNENAGVASPRLKPPRQRNRQGPPVAMDVGFIVDNELNHPDLTAIFGHLAVKPSRAA